MGELVVNLYMSLAELFAGLFPKRFTAAVRTGPMWRRIMFGLFVGFGSLAVGLVVAAIVMAAGFLLVAVVIGIVRLF